MYIYLLLRKKISNNIPESFEKSTLLPAVEVLKGFYWRFNSSAMSNRAETPWNCWTLKMKALRFVTMSVNIHQSVRSGVSKILGFSLNLLFMWCHIRYILTNAHL